jgi:hypothetical protein
MECKFCHEDKLDCWINTCPECCTKVLRDGPYQTLLDLYNKNKDTKPCKCTEEDFWKEFDQRTTLHVAKDPEVKAWIALELALESYAPIEYLREYQEVLLGRHPADFNDSNWLNIRV